MDLASSLAEVPSKSIRLEDDEVLYHQGDDAPGVYLIREGYLKFSKMHVCGTATISAIVGRNQVFGEGLCDGNSARHTVTAKRRAEVQAFTGADFQQALLADAVLGARIVAMLAQRQTLVDRRIHAIMHLDVRARIASLLNDLSTHYGERCQHGHEVDVPLTQQELAELVGASRPVVSSRLNALRREGVVAYSRGYICVENLAALNQLAYDPASEM